MSRMLKRRTYFEKTNLFICRYVLVTLLFGSIVFANSAEIHTPGFKLETFKTHSRLVLSLDEQTPYSWKNGEKEFSLFLRGIEFADLGIPSGEEAQWAKGLQELEDPRVSSLSIKQLREGLKIEGRWKFPLGAFRLAHPKMESFEYRERNPSRILVDFWTKKGPTLQEVALAERESKRRGEMEQVESLAESRRNRKIANEQKKVEAEDLGKFCRRPMNEKHDIFLPFITLHETVNFDLWVTLTSPDQNFLYYQPENKNRDAQYVRLALDLYRKGSFALVLRTLDFFEKEHPGSSYRSEMKFLRANSLIKISKKQEGEEVLQQLMDEFPQSAAAIQSAMFLAVKRNQEKLHLAALQSFFWLVKNHPEHRLSWLFHLGAAESLYGLKHTERAAKEYEWVIKNAVGRQEKAEAAARLGDLYFEKFQYENALAEYYQVITDFPKEMEKFPSVHLNRAEALYWLGQYEEAKKGFLGFIEKYGSHPAGWRATYRLGEIEGRVGDEHSREWFIDTVNRFPLSSGATLARLRLLPCGDHAGFNAEVGIRFLDGEAAKFSGNNEVLMTRYPEYWTLARVRSLVGWSKEKEAFETTIRDLATLKNRVIRNELFFILEVLFRHQIDNLLKNGKKAEALAFYQENSNLLPKEMRYQYPEYLLQLSNAASDLSLSKLGEQFVSSYQEAVGWKFGRSISSEVAGNDPEDPIQKLKKSETRFVEAKSIWISGRAVPGSAEMNRVQSLLSEVAEESPFSFQSEIVLGLLNEKQGKFKEALSHAAKAQLLNHSKQNFPGRLDSWLVRLESKCGDPKIILEVCSQLEARIKNQSSAQKTSSSDEKDPLEVLGVPPALRLEEVILMQTEIYEKQNRWREAADGYSRILNAVDSHSLLLNRFKFGYARALLKTNDRKSQAHAQVVLKEILESKTNDLWKKIAKNALESGLNKPEIAKEGKK